MKLALNVMYVSGFMFFLICLHGCASEVTNPALHDGRWGEYNQGMGEQCASAAMLQGTKHGMSDKQIESLFGQCLFDQGLTI